MRSKIRTIAILAAVCFLGMALAGWLWWSRIPPVPLVDTDGLDAPVAAAIEQARAEVEARPRSAASWGRFGMVLFAHEMYADSAPVFAQAARLDPADPRWPYLRGLALVLQEPDEGIAALKQAAEIPPAQLTIKLRLAEELWKLDRVDEAAAIFDELGRVSPDNPRVLLGQGQIRARRGELQAALEPLTRAAGDPLSRRAAHTALAEVYRRLGKVAEAEGHSERAAQLGPDALWPDLILAETERLRSAK
jgi:tetratricopeptide (TPR) repeat protein